MVHFNYPHCLSTWGKWMHPDRRIVKNYLNILFRKLQMAIDWRKISLGKLLLYQ
jgi:hypothetical protein